MYALSEILTLPYNFIKSQYFWCKTDKQLLPGKKFYSFGRSIASKLLSNGLLSPKLFLNPVSIVRYFEFDYALQSFVKNNFTENNVLDISSPYLFGFYLASSFEGEYHYCNPDSQDLNLVRKYSSKLKFMMRYTADFADATKLPYSDSSFSHIFSISVIEHINGNGDNDAIKEMWRVLKPNGILILTFPIAKSFEEEFSDTDTYGLDVKQVKEKFFFQRIYDEISIRERLLNKISGFTILGRELFGESDAGFYKSYSNRWKNKGLRETVKDPYYISKYFRKFDSFSQINDSAVIGITLRKDK